MCVCVCVFCVCVCVCVRPCVLQDDTDQATSVEELEKQIEKLAKVNTQMGCLHTHSTGGRTASEHKVKHTRGYALMSTLE